MQIKLEGFEEVGFKIEDSRENNFFWITNSFLQLKFFSCLLTFIWPVPKFIRKTAYVSPAIQKERDDRQFVNKIVEGFAKYYPRTSANKLPPFLRFVMADSSMDGMFGKE